MSLRHFLWSYFRPYRGWMAMAICTTLAFALATVMLVGLLKPIFSDLLQSDGEVPSFLQEPSEDEETQELGVKLARFLNLHELFDWGYGALAKVFGIHAGNVFIFLPILFVVLFILRSLFAFLNGYLFQRIGLRATTDLRNSLYFFVLDQSSRFHAEHPSGEILSRIGNDVSVLQTAVTNRVLDLFQQSMTLIVLIWMLLSTHFQLGLISLVVAPAVFYPIYRFGRGMRRTSKRTQEKMADLSNLVAEAVRGHRVVKAFAMEPFEQARFEQATERHFRMKMRAQLLAAASSPVVESCIAIGAACFLVYAGYVINEGVMQPSQLVTFLTALVLIQDPVRRLNKVNLIIQESLAAAQRIQALMQIPNVIEEPRDPVRLDGVGEGILFHEVRFAYEKEVVLNGVDLSVPTGSTVALVGPSGAGKSTLVNLVPRFFDPQEGRVEVGGVDVRQTSLASLRSLIGVVTQDTMLFNDTVRGNIAYGREDFSLDKVRQAARAAYAHDFIEQLPEGYDTVIGEGGLKLSGGQRQRLAIARALAKDPPILILDEATSHLDSEAEALVQKALSNLMQGRTALVIAHRLSTIQRADHIVAMKEGRVVESGTHEELLAKGGVYRRLYDLQFRGDEDAG